MRVALLYGLIRHRQRVLRIAGAAAGLVVYIWVVAVRAAPSVKLRKAASRAAWKSRPARPRRPSG